MDKAPDAFRTISEVADDLDVPQHVLRFWETRFAQIRPMKRSGGRRYYRPDDVDLLRGIRRLLYGEGYTIRGVQRILKEHGIKAVQAFADGAPLPAAHQDGARANAAAASRDGNEDEADAGVETFDGGREADDDGEDDLVGGEAEARRAMSAPASSSVRTVAAAPDGLDAATRKRLNAALDDLIACRAALDAALKD